jgi:hypothetical protein
MSLSSLYNIIDDTLSSELRSVTVWFQNKRQTERKVALHHTANNDDHPTSSGAALSGHAHNHHHHHEPRSRRISNTSRSPPLSSSPSLSSTSPSGRTVRAHHIHHSRPQLSSTRRPSLDHVATRAELPQPLPRTPTRVRTYSSQSDPRSLYENMPSSPPSPLSPAIDRDRELIDFGLRRRRSRPTLEWACAVARIHGNRSAREEDDAEIEEMVVDAVGGDTEDEMDIPHEALTPSSSLGSQAGVWKSGRRDERVKPVAPYDLEATPKPVAKTVSEQDVMDAALALCGLGGSQ